MKSLLVSVVLGAGFLFSVGAYADAPAGSTAQCKDGTYYSGASHKGACRGHDGVKEWLDKTAATPAAKPAAAPAKKSTAAKSEAAPAATTTAAATPTKKTKKTKAAASAPATATPTSPSGATAQCRDGTYYSGASHRGACKGHQGVKAWLDNTAATAAAKPVAPPPKAAPTPTPTPAPKTPAATATAPAAAAPAAPAAPAATAPRTLPTPASQIEQKAGGGAGLVWVNSASKVYHCQGDEWYGKTKEGAYMSEAAASAGGNRAARGKECGK